MEFVCVTDGDSMPTAALGVGKYPLEDFYGTQAMFYSEGALKSGLQEWFLTQGVDQNPVGSSDMQLKNFLMDRNGTVPLMASLCSLVQHTSKNDSSIGNAYVNEAGNFVDDSNLCPELSLLASKRFRSRFRIGLRTTP